MKEASLILLSALLALPGLPVAGYQRGLLLPQGPFSNTNLLLSREDESLLRLSTMLGDKRVPSPGSLSWFRWCDHAVPATRCRAPRLNHPQGTSIYRSGYVNRDEDGSLIPPCCSSGWQEGSRESCRAYCCSDRCRNMPHRKHHDTRTSHQETSPLHKKAEAAPLQCTQQHPTHLKSYALSGP